ncbi:MAG: hypothetical protein WB580_17725 [Candidatus Binataceae bacterium]
MVAKQSALRVAFKRMAVNADQIERLKLPTRPSKEKDERFTSDESVDIDAVPTPLLRDMARKCIERHLPPGWMKRIAAEEKRQRLLWTGVIGRTAEPNKGQEIKRGIKG